LTQTARHWPLGRSPRLMPAALVVGLEKVTPAGAVSSLAMVRAWAVAEPTALAAVVSTPRATVVLPYWRTAKPEESPMSMAAPPTVAASLNVLVVTVTR
jgi:hypothetical protein